MKEFLEEIWTTCKKYDMFLIYVPNNDAQGNYIGNQLAVVPLESCDWEFLFTAIDNTNL